LPAAIIADNDGPGEFGARQLQGKLRNAVIIKPGSHKDARDWVKGGATRGEVLELISEARNARS
jgi:hypothetical protein